MEREDRWQCQCCGEYSLDAEMFEICDICGWQDDHLQNDKPDYKGGANKMSLNEAKEAYKKGLPIQ